MGRGVIWSEKTGRGVVWVEKRLFVKIVIQRIKV